MGDQPSSVNDRRRLPRRSSRAGAVTVALCLLVLLAASGVVVPPAQASHDTEPSSGDPLVFAAGDIARPPGSDPNVGNVRVADLIEDQSPQPDLILTLGDNQYDSGTLAQFNGENAFDETWGRFKSRMRPTFGDEDYGPGGPTDTGYYDYFNGPGNPSGPAGPENLGYYSFDIGAWHVVVLNTEVDTAADSAQADWLRNDLATHPRTCTLATAHRPFFSSNQSGSGNMEALAGILYDNGADLLLSGHVHSYERFRKQDLDGGADANGFRQFVVGTGGHSTGSLVPTPEAGSEARGDKYGVLKLTLRPTSYAWDFIALPG
ncbi:MAG: metallophosphoesterase, partial [Actinomycetota bacterium]